jgi:hypothetical protein
MDWTTSPFVAIWFALDGHQDGAGDMVRAREAPWQLDGVDRHAYHFGVPAESPDPPSPIPRSGDMARQRLMLDTNIWSRLAEQGQQYQFNQLVRNRHVDDVMPPATLLEVLRTQDRQLRRAVTKLVCRRVWRRLTSIGKSSPGVVTDCGRARFRVECLFAV